MDERRRLAEVYGRYTSDPDKRRAWSPENPGNASIVAERVARSRRLLRAAGLFPVEGLDVLEVGCGSGAELVRLDDWGGGTPRARTGVDLLPGRWSGTGPVRLVCADARHLPFRDERFDLVMLLTVVSSVLDPGVARDLAAESRRVLRSGGGVLWYDLRRDNPANPHVRGVGDGEVRALFPDFEVRLESTTVLPVLARRLGRATGVLYPVLKAIPVLRTHLVGVLRKPETTRGGGG